MEPLDPKRPDGKCGAPTRATGNPCRREAGWGTDHAGSGPCRLHAGAVPNQSTRHERLTAEATVREVKARWVIPDTVAPGDFIAEELRRSAAAVRWLDGKVSEQTDEHLSHDIRVTQSSDGLIMKQVEPRPSVWVRMWQDERKLGMSAARTAVELGIRAADHELSRATADTVIRIVRDALTAAGGDVTAGEAVVVTALAELAAPQE